MTRTGEGDDAVTRLAAETLDLSPDAPPKAARAAIYERLRDDEFLPGPRVHDAIVALARGPAAASPSLREEVRAGAERQLESAVDAFAREFFALAIADRRARWDALSDICKGHDRALTRLQGLAPGLGVRAERWHDRSPHVEQMVALALALFIQPPVERARNRLAGVRALRESTDCRRAAKRFKRRFRPVARLVPELTDDLLANRRVKPRRFRVSGPIRATCGMAVLATLLVFAWIIVLDLTTPRPISRTVSRPRSASGNPGTAADSLERQLRDAFKAVLKKRLAESGKPLDDAALQRVVNAQPVSLLFPTLLTSLTGDDLRRADRESLDRALRREGLVLEESELTAVADKVFPKSSRTKRSAKSRGSSPSPITAPVPR